MADLRASLVEAGPRPRVLLDELGGGFGPVNVMSSSVLAAPCVFPGRTIGLPNRCEEELTDAELKAVLAHEVAHVARGDHWWSGFLRVVMALLWVQPLNRIALRGALEAAELTCDDWALARTGERYGLGSSISRVAEWASSAMQHHAIVSMVGSDGGAVSSRVRRILLGTRREEPFWLRGLAAAVFAVPLLWLPTVPAPSTVHASIIIEEREIGPVPDVVSAEPDAAERRVFIAKIRGG